MKPIKPTKSKPPQKAKSSLKPIKSKLNPTYTKLSSKSSSIKHEQKNPQLIKDKQDYQIDKHIRHHKPYMIVQKVRHRDLTDIKPGSILRFKYTSVYDPIYKAFPTPVILVLNSNYQGKMHGLALRFLKPHQVNVLKRLITNNNMSQPYSFYHNVLKKYLNNISQNIYRTYSIYKVNNRILISYKFNTSQKDKAF